MTTTRPVILSTLAAALLAVAVAASASLVAAQALPDPPERLDRDKAGTAPSREMDRSRAAFVYLPADGEIRISYEAHWDNAVVIYRPRAGREGGWEEVARSVRETKKVPLEAGPYVVTAWSTRGRSGGGDEAWRQDQYQITGTPQGFVVGFDDGREPKFDDARVEFVWAGARGTAGAAATSGAGRSAEAEAEARYPTSGAGAGVPRTRPEGGNR